MKRKTVCLCVIVKDEVKTLPRLFASLKDTIDYWVVCDTGSTDGTQAWLERQTLAMPGEWFSADWVDFAHNRNIALSRAQGKCEYILVMDADQELAVTDPAWQARIDTDAVSLRFAGDLDYTLLQVFRDGMPWAYREPVHEHITCAVPFTQSVATGVRVVHHADGGHTSGKRFERDLKLLQAKADAEPDHPRTRFYLAQTQKCLGLYAESHANYLKRSRMTAWEEEGWYAQYMAAVTAERARMPMEVWANLAYAAFDRRPSRIEPLVWLANALRLRGCHALAYRACVDASNFAYPDTDILFIERAAYAWRAVDERSIAAYYTGRYDESLRLCDELLRSKGLPAGQRDRILLNRKFAASKKIMGVA